jgi:hypothetical protein
MSSSPIDYTKLAKTHGSLRSAKEEELNAMPGLSDVPAFLQQSLDMSKVRQVVTEPKTEQDRRSTAAVDTSDPYRIKVLAPDLYGPPVQWHELVHTHQDTRNKQLPQVAAQLKGSGRSNYDYGGIQGLQAARLQGKTISDFNYEQQAEMVKDYKWQHDQYLNKAKQGALTTADEKAMYDLQQAYHPFIQQLASMPGTKENLQRNPLLELVGLQKPVPLGANPAPPGLPAYNTPGLGVLPADPLMGGKSQTTPLKLVGGQSGIPSLNAPLKPIKPMAGITLTKIKEMAQLINPALQTGQSKFQALPQQPKEALNKYANPEAQPPKISFAFNKAWSKPGPYATKLIPQEEQEFRKWAAANPNSIRGEVGPAPNFDPSPMADYDVRGHFHAAKTGDPAATLTPNKWDGKIHGNDKFKTPYNGGFSNESMYALPNAPRWIKDRLMTADGRLVTDETPRKPLAAK